MVKNINNIKRAFQQRNTNKHSIKYCSII